MHGRNFCDIISGTGNPTFIETLGIYYQEDSYGPNDTDSVNKTEKRVITYTLNSE